MKADGRRCIALMFAGVLVVSPAVTLAQDDKPFAIETPATTALVLDVETGTVLFEKSASERFEPASLAKIMTVETVLSALDKGEVTAQTAFPVSDHAWRSGGAPSRTATMFAAVRSTVPVDALLRGVMVQGANDAAIILGEGIAGTESAFAVRMNERASEIGLADSHFVNATGLPAEGQFTTARDVAQLSLRMRQDYPAWYGIYAQPEFEWNKILQRNRNPLLRGTSNATGLATGFAEGQGYSIAALAEDGPRGTIAVLSGLTSDAVRTKETERLLAWARDSFERRILFTQILPVGTANVFGGFETSVPLLVKSDVVAFVPKGRPDLVRAEIRYDGPLHAPVEQNARVGTLHITIDGKPALDTELFAGKTIHQGTFSMRAMDAAQEIAFGWIRKL
ncbi:D-alanyl-D-alanine carboxypeptidase (penicillin-binding protein 5/6) [Aureimonas jatrophae]|uniref:serine-type D-Ala-D-Ala carboxypeptidase n=2 Tax=Aureimonas jatrophae TaxID=1166073 RepID=A0A1H0GZ58_9HYPH|nr:D-alanyl-D-alanine carboxypeptidase (penicillin-binding protein 5/6) [Aureimonas jatrophae]